MVFISATLNKDTGFKGQYQTGAPFLAGRMERDMATGKCFNTPASGGVAPCEAGFLFTNAQPSE